jgi:hypothetical protein
MKKRPQRALSEELPSFVFPSKKLIVPVGVPLQKPGKGVTLAVKATACPNFDGLVEDTRAVEVPEMLVLMRTLIVPAPQFSVADARVCYYQVRLAVSVYICDGYRT